MKRNQFTFYRSYFDAIERLSVEEKGEILCALCAYALDEIMPENLSPIAETVFTLVKPTLDAGRKKAVSGQKGGRIEKSRTVSTIKASKMQAVSKYDPENETEKDAEIEIEDECLTARQTGSPLFVPPTVEKVADYCKQNGFSIDAAKFVDYYTANGWHVGKSKMRDWQAAVRNWNRKEKHNGTDQFESIWNGIGQSF